MKPLTDMEQKMLAFISDKIKTDGYSPTVRDIRSALGIKSTATVHSYLLRLADKGYILNERMTYDYEILGASDYEVAVCRTVHGGTEKAFGTLSIEGDELIFNENSQYGATVG